MFFLRFSECHVTFLQAVSFPAVQSLWGRWAPPLERSKLVSFTYLGTLVITPHYRLTPFPTFWSKYVFFFVYILAQYLGFVFFTVLAGTMFGMVGTFSTSGLLCQYGFDNGWGSIFYITGYFVWSLFISVLIIIYLYEQKTLI